MFEKLSEIETFAKFVVKVKYLKRTNKSLSFSSKTCYENQVQKGGEAILNSAAEKNNANMVRQSMNNGNDATKNSGMNENLKRY